MQSSRLNDRFERRECNFRQGYIYRKLIPPGLKSHFHKTYPLTDEVLEVHFLSLFFWTNKSDEIF